MKRISLFFTRSVLTSVFSVFLIACKSTPAKQYAFVPVDVEKQVTTSGTIEIETSPKVELLTIACKSAGFPEFRKNKNPKSNYIADSETWFKEYSGHPFVLMLEEMNQQKRMNWDEINTILMFVSDDMMNFTSESDFIQSQVSKKWNEVEADLFLENMNSYANETKFCEFYNQHKKDYQKQSEVLIGNLKDYKIEKWLYEFYRDEKNHNITIHVSESLNGINAYYLDKSSENIRFLYCFTPDFSKKDYSKSVYHLAKSFIKQDFSYFDNDESMKSDFQMIFNMVNVGKTRFVNEDQVREQLIFLLVDLSMYNFMRNYESSGNLNNIYNVAYGKDFMKKYNQSLKHYLSDKRISYNDFMEETIDMLLDFYKSLMV